MPYLTTDGDLNQAKRKRAGEALADGRSDLELGVLAP